MAVSPEDYVSVIHGFKERIEIGLNFGLQSRWKECIEVLEAVSADIRSYPRENMTKEDIEGRKQLLNGLEAALRNVREASEEMEEICVALDRSNSPEPPADPDVWSPPPQPVNRNSKKTPKSTISKQAPNDKPVANTSKMSAAAEKPATSLLPSNSAGEVFDTSLYDFSIVQAVRATMTLSDEGDSLSLDDVIGMKDVKQILNEAIKLPLRIPAFFKGLRSPWKAMCLAGPPGTGKTLIARAIASEANSTYFNVSSSDLTNKWRGDSEKIVRLLFELARFYAPSIIFIDEIDTFGGQRGMSGEHEASRRVKSEFLVQMDGAKNKFSDRRVFVLAATNIPWDIDEALRRRFEKRIFVPLPDVNDRAKIIEASLKELAVADEVDIEELARRSEGFSGADVVSLCRTAAYNVLRRFDLNQLNNTIQMESLNTEPIRMIDFEGALESVSASVHPETVQRCREWCEAFGSK